MKTKIKSKTIKIASGSPILRNCFNASNHHKNEYRISNNVKLKTLQQNPVHNTETRINLAVSQAESFIRSNLNIQKNLDKTKARTSKGQELFELHRQHCYTSSSTLYHHFLLWLYRSPFQLSINQSF